MAQSFTNLLYHLVFSTKHRQPIITSDVEGRVHRYIGGIVRGQGGIALEINGMPDHLHILAKLSQNKSIKDVLRDLKADSSGWIHDNFPGMKRFAWQAGYSAFSVSESQVERVRKYIQNQKQHHRRVSFQEELIALLKAHKIDYDEKYLWL
jgi:REP element-mobilizing transposase RayT